MPFRKPSHQSFFLSRVSPFSPGDRYFHETSKRTIRHMFSQNQRWTKSVILWEVYSDWFAISRNSAQTCRNARNDKCRASFIPAIYYGRTSMKKEIVKNLVKNDELQITVNQSLHTIHSLSEFLWTSHTTWKIPLILRWKTTQSRVVMRKSNDKIDTCIILEISILKSSYSIELSEFFQLVKYSLKAKKNWKTLIKSQFYSQSQQLILVYIFFCFYLLFCWNIVRTWAICKTNLKVK